MLIRFKNNFFVILFFIIVSTLNIFSQNIYIHDPVLIKQDSLYYLFSTGWGISKFYSRDLINWNKDSPVFEESPLWTKEVIKGFKGHIWAPDILFYNGNYYLFYSVSTFGKNNSCIGVAINKTLHSKDDSYKWIDHGIVIQSVKGRDFWNAIDPNVIFDEDSTPWLAFGSFWGGIKLVKLKKDLLGIEKPEEWYTIARRKFDFASSDTLAGEGAIEAPFIFRKDGYYYLFVSFDYCCRGINSNYKIAVGKSKNVYGPYIDKNGIGLDKGGGTIILQGNDKWSGVGHCSVFSENGIDYLVFHGYDKNDNGKSKLLIKKINWVEGWPEVSLNNKLIDK